MRKRHIVIFVVAAILAFGTGLGFGILENQNTVHYEAKEESPEESITPASVTAAPPESLTPVTTEQEGYLLRYAGDRTVAYKILQDGQLEVEFVANEVRIDLLPDKERKKLEEGIRFDNKEKLYGAIENYSS
ncbi:MAG: hypothetical protein HFI90_02190 [Clostridia bacterium]|nr:hypothetical protein [Clostridia bacterium]